MTENPRTARRPILCSPPSSPTAGLRARMSRSRTSSTPWRTISPLGAHGRWNQPRRSPDEGGDQGSISLIAVVVMAGLLAMVALVVDGGGRVAAAISADNAAAAAARAGGQAIDTTAVMAGEPIVADPMAAAAAARAHLRASGVTGDARVEPGGRSIVVTTSVTYEPVFLGLMGVGQTRITGTARAALVDLQVGLLENRP